jgi:hypothetical protein
MEVYVLVLEIASGGGYLLTVLVLGIASGGGYLLTATAD